jgi:hypothetical protein
MARRMTAWASLVALLAGLAMPMLPGLHVAATALPALSRRRIGVDMTLRYRPLRDHCLHVRTGPRRNGNSSAILVR